MSFVANTLVVLRESLEAFLIIGVLLGMAIKLGAPQARRPLIAGAIGGLLLSLVMGVMVVTGAKSLSDQGAEAFEGIASLVAVAVLTYMIIWMYKHTQDVLGGFTAKARDLMDTGNEMALASLTFIAVAREGFETVIFIGADADGSVSSLIGAVLLGMGIAAIVALLLFNGVIRLNMRDFFAATGAILVVFAAGLLSTSMHDLMEVGWIPDTGILYNIGHIVSQDSTFGSLLKAVFGYRDHPRVLEAAVWWAYMLGMGIWYMRPILAAKKAGSEPTQAE